MVRRFSGGLALLEALGILRSLDSTCLPYSWDYVYVSVDVIIVPCDVSASPQLLSRKTHNFYVSRCFVLGHARHDITRRKHG